MVISSQKLASGGIRRLTALTGEAAEVVQRKADALSEQVVFNNNQVRIMKIFEGFHFNSCSESICP